jgi:hypothetical protein
MLYKTECRSGQLPPGYKEGVHTMPIPKTTIPKTMFPLMMFPLTPIP